MAGKDNWAVVALNIGLGCGEEKRREEEKKKKEEFSWKNKGTPSSTPNKKKNRKKSWRNMKGPWY